MAEWTRELGLKRKLQTKRVDLNNGDHLFVQELDGHTVDSYLEFIEKEPGLSKGNLWKNVYLITLTACKKNGELIFATSDVDELVKSLSIKNITEIAKAALEINGLTSEEIENITKNLGGGQDAASSSGSARK